MREVEESVDHLRRVTAEMSRGLELMTEAEWMGGFGILIWNLETNEMWLSEGAYKIFGLKRKSALTQPELVGSVNHPDDVEALEEGLAATVAGGHLDLVHRIVHPNGEVRLVHSKAQRIERDEHHPAILLGTMVDVTPVDNAEA
jgi:PAS domain-containing protein